MGGNTSKVKKQDKFQPHEKVFTSQSIKKTRKQSSVHQINSNSNISINNKDDTQTFKEQNNSQNKHQELQKTKSIIKQGSRQKYSPNKKISPYSCNNSQLDYIQQKSSSLSFQQQYSIQSADRKDRKRNRKEALDFNNIKVSQQMSGSIQTQPILKKNSSSHINSQNNSVQNNNNNNNSNKKIISKAQQAYIDKTSSYNPQRSQNNEHNNRRNSQRTNFSHNVSFQDQNSQLNNTLVNNTTHYNQNHSILQASSSFLQINNNQNETGSIVNPYQKIVDINNNNYNNHNNSSYYDGSNTKNVKQYQEYRAKSFSSTYNTIRKYSSFAAQNNTTNNSIPDSYDNIEKIKQQSNRTSLILQDFEFRTSKDQISKSKIQQSDSGEYDDVLEDSEDEKIRQLEMLDNENQTDSFINHPQNNNQNSNTSIEDDECSNNNNKNYTKNIRTCDYTPFFINESEISQKKKFSSYFKKANNESSKIDCSF